MMRRPRASVVVTVIPTLAALVEGCQRDTRRMSVNPPPPLNPPEVRDAGVQTNLDPQPINPQRPPDIMPAGAMMVVDPTPVAPPAPTPSAAPAPSAAAPSAMAPSSEMAAPAAAAAAPARSALTPGAYVVHNHPPGTPCRTISHTEMDQTLRRVRP